MATLWYQKTGGAEAWSPALSDLRQKVINEVKPAFITVLDAVTAPSDDWGKEEFSKMRYSGPAYFDWDAEDVADAIPHLHAFLDNLKANDVNLKAIKLYATGGRGFHCEIPEAMVNPKPSKTGTLLLPYVYRDMALEMATETMDLRVYTARKGRMWRTPGVERTNKAGEKTGRYKVSITLGQAWAMTPDMYQLLTSKPCAEVYREPPELSIYLSAMFDKARAKVEQMSKLRAKSKGDSEKLAHFKGQFPPTVLKLMSGENLVPGTGFHKIAMQLAITANALGKSWEELLELSQGLCKSHESDSDRYNTPRKRKEELRRMWEYTHDNDLYEYSAGGIRNLLKAGTLTPDLDGPREGVGLMQEDPTEALPAEVQGVVDSARDDCTGGLILVLDGVYRTRPDEGSEKISSMGFTKPCRLVEAADNVPIGLEVGLIADRHPIGRSVISNLTFRSRAILHEFCMGRGAGFTGDDKQAFNIFTILNRRAEKMKNITYIIRKEGIDLIQSPESKDEVRKHTVWVSPEVVRGHTEGLTYRYAPQLNSRPIFNTDLHRATPLTDSPEAREWLSALLTMNSPVVVGQMLGWFVSCFHKQFYQAAYDQFPLLHPNGTAGSGKSLTTKLLAGMFYCTNPVVMTSASQSGSTEFSLKSAWTSSASIPVIIDEYKPSELGVRRYDFLLQHFRLLYNQGEGASGGINRGAAESSFRDITRYSYSAPTAYIGESQEMQTAVVQRTVAVGFNSTDSRHHTHSFNIASSEPYSHFMSQLGASLLVRSLGESVKSRVAALDPVRSYLRSVMAPGTHDRQVYNMAVVLCGLDYLADTLNAIFGDHFDSAISGLRESLVDHRDEVNTYAMAESSKVLNDMAMISRTEDYESEFAIRETHEYIVGEGFVEIRVKEAFVKYHSWCNRKGFKPLYGTPEGFINSLSKSAAVVDLRCFDSKLRGSSVSKVFRLSLQTLASEGVEMFKSKSLD